MKILISNDSKSAHYFQRMAIARVFVACGHEAIIWDINKKSAHDAFDEMVDVDIFMGQTYNLTEALIDCISEKPAIKVIMKAGDWGSNTPEVSSKYPILVAQEKEKQLLRKLRDKTGKPDILEVHYPDKYLNETHNFWREDGFRVESFMLAADIFEYTNGQYKEEYASDLCIISGYWPYKGQTYDKWLLPLCENFKYKIKIFGNSPWPCPQYMGVCKDGQEKHVYKSAKICINLHEPHSQEYGFDVNERFFKLSSNKCFTICDRVQGLEDSYDVGTINSWDNPKDFMEEIVDKLSIWDKFSSQITRYKEQAYKQTLEKHTYFDRVHKMLNCLGISNNVLEKKQEFFEKLNIKV